MNETETATARWIFQLRLSSRPGVLAAVTAVFADRGVSIETLNAHDTGIGGTRGSAVLTFAATSAKKDYLARLLRRLAPVQEVAEYRYGDDTHTRKSVTARIALASDRLRALLPDLVLCDIMSETENETLALLLGPPIVLDTVLAALQEQGILAANDASVIVV